MATNQEEIRAAISEVSNQNRCDPFRMFIFGKTGAGKSSLINTLLHQEVATEGRGLRAQTTRVESHAHGVDWTDCGIDQLEQFKTTINDVPVTLWDSPGLKDPYTNGQETLKEIKANCQGVDLFVYCIQITQSRAGQDEFDSIADLTNALGKGIWKSALIALTFANEVKPPTAVALTDLVSQWKTVLMDALERAGIPRNDAVKIPVIPASYREESLPGIEDWYGAFWIECVLRTVWFSKLIALLQLTQDSWIDDERRRKELAKRIAQRLIAIGDAMDDDIHRKLREILNSVNPVQLVSIIAAVVQTPGRTPNQNTDSVVRTPFLSRTVYIACAATAAIALIAVLVIKYNRN